MNPSTGRRWSCLKVWETFGGADEAKVTGRHIWGYNSREMGSGETLEGLHTCGDMSKTACPQVADVPALLPLSCSYLGVS